MELASAEDAALAIRTMDGYPFDKRHKFAVNRFTDVEKLANLDEKYQEPEEKEYEDRVSGRLVCSCDQGMAAAETTIFFPIGTPAIMAHGRGWKRPVGHVQRR